VVKAVIVGGGCVEIAAGIEHAMITMNAVRSQVFSAASDAILHLTDYPTYAESAK